MKKSKIIAPALGVLVLSTAASISGTVAWFTANNSVSVQGMQVKTKVGNNLLIAEDVLASSSHKADNLFETGPLNQSVKGVLEPVSSINGTSFFYTTNAKADGDAKEDVYITYNAATPATNTTKYANAFSEAYGVEKSYVTAFTGSESLNAAVAYVDYVFQLRVQNLGADEEDLNITSLTLTYAQTDDEPDAGKAFRVAIFAEDITENAAAGATTLISILRASSATNFVETPTTKAVGAERDVEADPEHDIEAVSALQEVTYGDAATLATVTNDSEIYYYKVTVRLWIEGEDTTCKNDTYAALTGSWALDLDVELGGENDPVEALELAVAE